MADTVTTNYEFVLPEPNGSDDAWGVKLNDNFSALDVLLKSTNDTISGNNTTLTQTIDGVNTRLSSIESDIAYNNLNAAAGWQTLPGGLILCWGNHVFVAAEDLPFTVQLPITFSSIFSIQTTLQIDSGTQMDAFDIYIRSNTMSSFYAQVSSQVATNFGNATCRWLVIGLV